MGSTFGIDVRLSAENFDQEAGAVEGSLRRIDDQGKTATRALKRGFDDAARSARGAKQEVDSLDSLIKRAGGGWDSFRRGAEKAVGKSSQSEIDRLTKLTNEMTAGIVDSTESTKGLGKAMKKTGEDGEISLERIIKGQIKMNAANVKAAGSFLLMGAFASRAMGVIQEKTEEGYRQIVRLGRAIGGAIVAGQGLGDFEGGTTLDRREALIREQIRLAQGGEKTGVQKAASAGLSILGAPSMEKTREKTVGSLKDMRQELVQIERKRQALNQLAKMGVNMAELEVMETQSLNQIQQRAVDLRKQRNEAIESGLDAIKRLSDFTKDEVQRVREEWKAEQSRLESVVAGVDKQFAAQVRLRDLEKDLGNAVRRRVISLDRAVDAMNEQRRLAKDDLHPEMKFLRDLGGQYAEAMGVAASMIGKAAVAAGDLARRQAEARNEAILEEQRVQSDQRKLNQEHQELLERRTTGGGARAGLRDIKEDLLNIGEFTRTTLVDAFGLLEQQLVDTFATGRFEAKAFLQDISRLGIQLGMRGLAASLLPSSAPAPGAANGADFIVPGFANGGSGRMRAKNSSDQVPVFFMAQAGERVIVETHQQSRRSDAGGGGAVAPVVNNQLLVDGGRMALDALKSPAGRREVINIMVANAAELRRVLR